MNENRIVCSCCARQIIHGNGKGDKWVTFGPVTLLGINQYACCECSADIDENGLFPEERGRYGAR